jgi:hypothetical protein
VIRRKLGATKRGNQKPAIPSLAVRPSVAVMCKRERKQRHLVEFFLWRQDLPIASTQTPCRECLQPGYLRRGTQWCFDCRMGALHPHGPQDQPAWRFCRHCELCGDSDPTMALAGLAFACAQCCAELRTTPPQPAARCVDCDSTDPAGSWNLGLDGRRLCNTHCTQECRPEGYRLARAQLIVAKAGGLTGNMPCFTAPYADRSRLDAVMAHLPGDVDSLDPLFAAVPWTLLNSPVLAAVNEHRRDSGLPPWESFPPCGDSTAHYLLDPLPEVIQGSRIAAFGTRTAGRSHDANRRNPRVMRPAPRHTRKRKTFAAPRPPPPRGPPRPEEDQRDNPDGSDPDDRNDPDDDRDDDAGDADDRPDDDPDAGDDDDDDGDGHARLGRPDSPAAPPAPPPPPGPPAPPPPLRQGGPRLVLLRPPAPHQKPARRPGGPAARRRRDARTPPRQPPPAAPTPDATPPPPPTPSHPPTPPRPCAPHATLHPAKTPTSPMPNDKATGTPPDPFDWTC